jgi:hypothetical protein
MHAKNKVFEFKLIWFEMILRKTGTKSIMNKFDNTINSKYILKKIFKEIKKTDICISKRSIVSRLVKVLLSIWKELKMYEVLNC